jgi:hypothetical protein
MSTPDQVKFNFDPVIEPFVSFWTGLGQRTDETTRQVLGGLSDGSEIKSFQAKWSEALSKSMDAYMRTPAFLQAMKDRTDAAVKLKQRIDDWTCEVARNANIPTAGDISGLFERLKITEDAILSRLEHIDKRLDAIERRFGTNSLVPEPS